MVHRGGASGAEAKYAYIKNPTRLRVPNQRADHAKPLVGLVDQGPELRHLQIRRRRISGAGPALADCGRPSLTIAHLRALRGYGKCQ